MSTTSELLLERVRAATADEYTIERELGRGGMAAVFLARDIALERRVAIKVMLPDLVDVEGIADRFVIEAKTAAHLDHAGIVTVYSVKQRAGLLFIVMKYIDGRTLEEIISRQRVLDPAVVTSIVARVAEALQFAHSENVIHRDVKPSNIIIDARGRPVVTDFGIAKVTSARSITVTGSMLGTPTYMSPEQCRGLPATAASDQYSLGVMLYEMVAGRVPFSGTIFELIHMHCVEPPPPLAELAPTADAELVETITRMLAKAPKDRWPSLTEVARRLSARASRQRSSSEIDATIAEYVRAADTPSAIARRAQAPTDISGAATELATTPAPGLVVTPVEPAIEVGASVQLRVSEASGASLAGVRIAWRSEDPTIASVDEAGLVTGRSIGFAKITAAGGAAMGRVAVTVKPASVNTLVITPQNPALVTGGEVQLVATALDARGTTLAGQTVVWQSSDVSVCAVSAEGRAIAIAPGAATVTALCAGVRATAEVRVALPAVERVVIDPGAVTLETDDTRRLAVQVFGADDRPLRERLVIWHSTVPTVVTVDAEGTVTGATPGTGAVIATCEAKQGLVSVTVRAAPVAAVRIQPAQIQLEVGRSMQLKAASEDKRGRAVAASRLEWQSDDDRIALVDASGKVHAVREGHTMVRAAAGDIASAIEVTVVPRPAKSIRIEPHAPSLAVGAFMTLDATVLDADGAPLAGRTVAWTSDNSSVVAVDGGGACEAKKPGAVRITAACELVKTVTKLSVSAPVPPPVAPPLSPTGASTPVGAGRAAEDAPTVQFERVAAGAAAGHAAPAGHAAESAPRPGSRAPQHDSAARASAVPVAAAPATRRVNRLIPAGVAVVLIAVAVWTFTKGDAPVPAGSVANPVAGSTPPTDAGGASGSASSAGAPPPSAGGQVAQGQSNAPGSGVASANDSAPARGTTPASNQTAVTPPTGRVADGRVGDGRVGVGGSGGRAAATRNPDSAQRSAAPPATTQRPPATTGDARGAVTPPVSPPVTPPARVDTAATPPPVVTPPTDPPTAPPAGGAASADATRALLCTQPALPANLLTDAIAADPAGRLATLYVARDASDTRARSSLLSAVRDMQRARATASALRSEPAGSSCEWIVALEFNFTNAFGQPRQRAWNVRVQLEAVNGAARLKSISNAVSR